MSFDIKACTVVTDYQLKFPPPNAEDMAKFLVALVLIAVNLYVRRTSFSRIY